MLKLVTSRICCCRRDCSILASPSEWVLVPILLLICASGGGCTHGSRQTISHLWQNVPQVRWTGTRVESEQEATPAEPSVTANVAANTADSDEDSGDAGRVSLAGASSTTSTDQDSGRKLSATAVLSQRGGRVAAIPTEDEQRTAARELADARPDDGVRATNHGEDQIERLKEALSEDARRAKEPNRHAGGVSDARVRVESLLARARRLFDVGQLTEARRTAQLAQDLGETARLDYSPDEERPIDLVHRIDDQMQTTAEALPNPTAELTDSESNPSKAEASKIAQRDEPAGLSWWRGSGIGVFRRERKLTPGEEAVNSVTAVAESPSVSLGLDADANSETDSRKAVVQANRSVALSTFALSRNEANSANGYDGKPRSSDDSTSLLEEDRQEGMSSQLSKVNQRNWEPDSGERSPAVDATTAMNDGPQLIADEVAPIPPELEEVRPVSAFRNAARRNNASQSVSNQSPEEPNSAGGWFVTAACFAVCSLLAWGCYRRGAT